MMAEVNRCPKCHAELPADAPGGLCPKCLLQAGFESQAEPSAAYRPRSRRRRLAGFVPPTVEELARRISRNSKCSNCSARAAWARSTRPGSRASIASWR